MLDVHKESEKATMAQESMLRAELKLPVSSRKIYEATHNFNETLYEIFRTWLGVARKKGDQSSSFDEVLNEQTTFVDKKASWLGVSSEIENFPSWTALQAFSSSTLSTASTKEELDARVKQGKDSRTHVLVWIRSVRQSAVSLKTRIDKLVADEEKEKMAQGKNEAEADGARLLNSAVSHSAPPAARMSAKGPAVPALFSAQSLNMPEMHMFSIKDKDEFNNQWICSQHAASELHSKAQPYGVSAGPWLAHMQSQPAVASCFSVFMADFLGSQEYQSSVGRASSSVSGIGSMAASLRQMVVLPNNTLVQLTKQQIAMHISGQKQRGHEHTYVHTYVRACVRAYFQLWCKGV